mmetsp:Transcript_33202/g.105862  ORF Transcript_33202/g.105862 Transcript_33202/m.105862 type:complete len:249 (-) Transcript_33202:79-825(-)
MSRWKGPRLSGRPTRRRRPRRCRRRPLLGPLLPRRPPRRRSLCRRARTRPRLRRRRRPRSPASPRPPSPSPLLRCPSTSTPTSPPRTPYPGSSRARPAWLGASGEAPWRSWAWRRWGRGGSRWRTRCMGPRRRWRGRGGRWGPTSRGSSTPTPSSSMGSRRSPRWRLALYPRRRRRRGAQGRRWALAELRSYWVSCSRCLGAEGGSRLGKKEGGSMRDLTLREGTRAVDRVAWKEEVLCSAEPILNLI